MIKQLLAIILLVIIFNCLPGGEQSSENVSAAKAEEPVKAVEDYTITCVLLDITGQGVSVSTVNASSEIISYAIIINNTGDKNLTGVSTHEVWGTVGAPEESISSDGILQVGENWIYCGQYTVTKDDMISYDTQKGYLSNDVRVLVDNAESKRTALKVPVLFERHDFSFPGKNCREVGADGHTITLENNLSARNPTYQQLLAFLESDITDTVEYDDSTFVCADYAEKVHNNAEAAGISCAWVAVDFDGVGGNDHACNAFNTVDKGLVYVDCTQGDKFVNLVIGTPYTPYSIVDNGYEYETMGTVKDYEVTW